MTDTKPRRLSLPSKPETTESPSNPRRRPIRGTNSALNSHDKTSSRPRHTKVNAGEEDRPARQGAPRRDRDPAAQPADGRRDFRRDERKGFGRSQEEPRRAPRFERSEHGERDQRRTQDRDEAQKSFGRTGSARGEPRSYGAQGGERRPAGEEHRPRRFGQDSDSRPARKPWSEGRSAEGERSFRDRPPRSADREERRPPRPGFGDERKPRGHIQTWRADAPQHELEPRNAFRSQPRSAERSHAESMNSEEAAERKEWKSSWRQRDNFKPSQPNLDAPEGSVRLSKRMTELGLCSRREADEYIERGWVTVDGVVVDQLGSKVMPDQKIELSIQAESTQNQRITILINKPIGYVSGQAEDGYEPASVLVTNDNHWEEDPCRIRIEPRFLRKLAPAGRLDIDSTGLLVLTQDGRVAKQIIGEYSDVEKEYLVRVEGNLSAEGMKLLNHGLELDGVELQPAKVSWQNEDQLRFVLREGRKRQIRRMCELVGLRVVGLKRIRIGRVTLSKLPVGQWRYLGEHEKF